MSKINVKKCNVIIKLNDGNIIKIKHIGDAHQFQYRNGFFSQKMSNAGAPSINDAIFRAKQFIGSVIHNGYFYHNNKVIMQNSISEIEIGDEEDYYVFPNCRELDCS